MSDSKDLGFALINEVAGDKLNELVIDASEVALDSFINEGIFKEIPFFGTLYKTYKAAVGIREAIFAKKIFKFLTEIKDIPQTEREQFVNKLEEDEKFKNRVGEKLLVLIDQLDDLDKPTLIGRLFTAAIQGEIKYYEFLRLSQVIKDAFLPDLLMLKESPSGWKLSDTISQHLNSLGIMDLEIEEYKGDYRKMFGSDQLYKLGYKGVNRLGKLILKYALKYEPYQELRF